MKLNKESSGYTLNGKEYRPGEVFEVPDNLYVSYLMTNLSPIQTNTAKKVEHIKEPQEQSVTSVVEVIPESPNEEPAVQEAETPKTKKTTKKKSETTSDSSVGLTEQFLP